jgi:spermidine synthase
MRVLKRWLAGKDAGRADGAGAAAASVEISEAAGVRSLHLGGDAIQSSIRLANPDALELHYTRAMMGCLLFEPAPRDMLMIGLGGGSIARFVHRRLPATRITAVEINARVVALARAQFGLPPDDERLEVVVADGADYVPARTLACDTLLSDAFDDGAAVAALCTQRFYDACYAALRDGGVFVQNFMEDEPRFTAYLERLERSFDGRVLCMPSGDRVNMIVFGLKRDTRRIAIEDLKRDAARLQRRLGLPFTTMVKDLLVTNERSAGYLKLRAAD